MTICLYYSIDQNSERSNHARLRSPHQSERHRSSALANRTGLHCLRRVAEDPGYCASHEAIRRRYQHLGKKGEQLAHYLGAEQVFERLCLKSGVCPKSLLGELGREPTFWAKPRV